MATPNKPPVINDNQMLQSYYGSLESRAGYRLFLSGTRHFGYYDNPSSNPVKVTKSLRAMEAQMLAALDLQPGSTVLDAGCGVGHVALYMAQQGSLNVRAIDVVEHHVAKARRNVRTAGLSDRVTVRHMDYHHLDADFVPDASLDGIYTMETFVHATEPRVVLRNFLRALKPGGRLVMHEYDHVDMASATPDAQRAMSKVNEFSAMPGNAAFNRGVMESLLREEGFTDVQLKDLSPHVEPMLFLFYAVAYIPYLFVRLFGLERRFVNTVAGVWSYKGRQFWRYVQITARKPGNVGLDTHQSPT